MEVKTLQSSFEAVEEIQKIFSVNLNLRLLARNFGSMWRTARKKEKFVVRQLAALNIINTARWVCCRCELKRNFVRIKLFSGCSSSVWPEELPLENQPWQRSFSKAAYRLLTLIKSREKVILPGEWHFRRGTFFSSELENN